MTILDYTNILELSHLEIFVEFATVMKIKIASLHRTRPVVSKSHKSNFIQIFSYQLLLNARWWITWWQWTRWENFGNVQQEIPLRHYHQQHLFSSFHQQIKCRSKECTRSISHSLIHTNCIAYSTLYFYFIIHPISM